MDMSNSFGTWKNNIPHSNLNETIDYVLTGYDINTIPPSHHLLKYINQENKSNNTRLLDFGCGVGRNIIFLSNSLPDCQIYGYDNDIMLSQAKAFVRQKHQKDIENIENIHLLSNWTDVKKQKFDLIYTTLVFQHINEEPLSQYLKDIKGMTDTLLVESRRLNDDIDPTTQQHKNTWQIMEKNGCKPYFCSNNYTVDGNPEDHFVCIYKF